MKEKIIASFLAALMTAVTAAGPALAATQLGDFPGFLAEVTDGTSELDAYIVVGTGGSDPAGLASDIAGAVDIAATIAGLSYTTQTVSETTTAAGGLDRDGINIGTSSGGAALSAGGATFSNPFPATTVKTAQFSGLLDKTIKWNNNDYDIREQVDVSGVRMRHDFGTSSINGTERMVVQDSNVKYQYVFEKAINLSTATSAGSTGTISTPEYTKPIEIDILGSAFTIVGIGASSIKALSGSVCNGVTATNPCEYGDYTIYATQGGTTFVSVEIVDADGNTVDTLLLSGWSSGTSVSKDSTAADITVTVTTIAALQDGTVVGADLVVGPVGQTEKEYDTSADTTSTGTASDRFGAETTWGVQISGSGWANGYIPANGIIEVVYKPTETLYLDQGESVVFPNDYAELTYVGWGTDAFATYTIEPISGTITAYNNSKDTEAFGSITGIKISTDTSSSIVGLGNNFYDEAYILFNRTRAGMDSQAGGEFPMLFGFKDNAKNKILVNGTINNCTTAVVVTQHFAGSELFSCYGNTSATVRYDYKLTYGGAGEKDFWLNVTVNAGSNLVVSSMVAGAANAGNIQIGFQNRTKWTASQAPEFRLGDTSGTAETKEVNATTEGTAYNVGKATQDVVDDSGVIVVSPGPSGDSNKAVIKVPGKDLTNRVSFGPAGGVSTTAGDTVKVVETITTPVAVLDSEVTTTHKAKNIVSVGGSCVNSITAEALDLTYPTCGAASTVPEDNALIKAIDDAFTEGKVVVVVAGWTADDTRNAATVLQQYETLLAGEESSAVEVAGTTSADITPVTEEAAEEEETTEDETTE